MNDSLHAFIVAPVAVFTAWGLSEWNQVAGIAAFASTAIYSIVKCGFLIRDRLKSNQQPNTQNEKH